VKYIINKNVPQELFVQWRGSMDVKCSVYSNKGPLGVKSHN